VDFQQRQILGFTLAVDLRFPLYSIALSAGYSVVRRSIKLSYGRLFCPILREYLPVGTGIEGFDVSEEQSAPVVRQSNTQINRR